MTLFAKLALYNTFVRLVLVGALWLVLPALITRLSDQQTGLQLLQKHQGTLTRVEPADFSTYPKPVSPPPALQAPNWQQPKNVLISKQDLSRPIRINGQLYSLDVGKNQNEVRSLTQTPSQLILGTIAVILVLTFVIDLGYIHFLLRPLRLIINRKLRVIQDPSQFDFSPLPTTTLELSQLDGHINDLMRHLSATFTREKAFASQASHELLTPITVLRNRFDNLIADEQTPPHVAIRLVESQQTLVRLSKLVQKLLRLARIENLQYLKNDTVSVKAVVQAVLHDLEDHIALKDIHIELAIDEDIVMAPANQTLMYTMLLNLIGNAVRYNADHGQLFIGGETAENVPKLTIRDTGPGMSPEQAATLTQHGRLAEATVERTGIDLHNGIGLQLIRTVARFHQIDLSVDAQPGTGTSITLTFTKSR